MPGDSVEKFQSGEKRIFHMPDAGLPFLVCPGTNNTGGGVGDMVCLTRIEALATIRWAKEC